MDDGYIDIGVGIPKKFSACSEYGGPPKGDLENNKKFIWINRALSRLVNKGIKVHVPLIVICIKL